MRTIWLPLAILAAASNLAAQQAGLDGSRLRPAVDTFYTLVLSGGRVDTTGWATEAWIRATVGSSEAWAEVYRWHGRDGSAAMDSLLMSPELLPITEYRTNAAGTVRVTYSGPRVRVTIQPKFGSARQLDTTFASRVYSSASLDALARALAPTRTTRSIDFYFPFPSPLGLRPSTVKVTRSETVKGPRAIDIPCWVVIVQIDDVATTFWVSKSTGEIVQFNDNGGGAITHFRRPGAPVS